MQYKGINYFIRSNKLVFKLGEEHRLVVLVKRVLRRTIVFDRQGLGKLYSEELHDFYTSTNITNLDHQKEDKWDKRGMWDAWSTKQCIWDLRVWGEETTFKTEAEMVKILQYISRWMVRCEVESSASGHEHMAGFCNHGNEPYNSKTCRKFLD